MPPSTVQRLVEYKRQVEQEIKANILPFYLDIAFDHEHGGFFGQIRSDRTVDRYAPKGLTQHARMLWTFAHAARMLPDAPDAYSSGAEYAYKYLLDTFSDQEFGGFYWQVSANGQPLQTHKLVYGQAFAIYAVSEYYLLTREQPALDIAIDTWRLLERHTWDDELLGYFEAAERDWTHSTSFHVDEHFSIKSMNTHLHVLEAYTNLLRATDDAAIANSLRRALLVTLEHVINEAGTHLKLYMDETWRSLSDHISYGHDIEASWLLMEAAELLQDEALFNKTKRAALLLAEETLLNGVDASRALTNSDDANQLGDGSREWWPQAEAMVGFLNAYQLTKDARYLNATLAVWKYTQQFIVDDEHGEWFWGVDGSGRPVEREKFGLWKTPYHNGRACIELSRRLNTILTDGER